MRLPAALVFLLFALSKEAWTKPVEGEGITDEEYKGMAETPWEDEADETPEHFDHGDDGEQFLLKKVHTENGDSKDRYYLILDLQHGGESSNGKHWGSKSSGGNHADGGQKLGYYELTSAGGHQGIGGYSRHQGIGGYGGHQGIGGYGGQHGISEYGLDGKNSLGKLGLGSYIQQEHSVGKSPGDEGGYFRGSGSEYDGHAGVKGFGNALNYGAQYSNEGKGGYSGGNELGGHFDGGKGELAEHVGGYYGKAGGELDGGKYSGVGYDWKGVGGQLAKGGGVKSHVDGMSSAAKIGYSLGQETGMEAGASVGNGGQFSMEQSLAGKLGTESIKSRLVYPQYGGYLGRNENLSYGQKFGHSGVRDFVDRIGADAGRVASNLGEHDSSAAIGLSMANGHVENKLGLETALGSGNRLEMGADSWLPLPVVG